MPAPTDSVAITALPAVVTAAGTDIFPVVQGGITSRETNAQLLTFIQGAIALNASAITAGTLAVARGGTGLGAFTIGDLIVADGAASLAKLADVATGNVLRAGGVGVAPAWGQVVLTTDVTGILPSANGGTGVNNAGTITNASNTTISGGGTLALAGFTLTVPATLTAAGLAIANVFTAAQAITIADAVTNTVTTLATFTHNSSGTPAASFGSRLLFNLDSATVDDRNAAAIDVVWTTATDATRTSNIVFYTVNSAAAIAEALRIAPGSITLSTAGSTTVTFDAPTGLVRMLPASGRGLVLGTDGNEAMRIEATANVNIGTGATAAQAKLHTRLSNATTAAADAVLALTHSSTGTPAAGFGLTVLTQLESSTTDFTTAADDITTWVVATHASRTARRVFSIYDTAAREAFRIEASGAAPMIGFLGAAAAIRQTGGVATAGAVYTATEQAMLQAIYDAGRTFGFLT